MDEIIAVLNVLIVLTAGLWQLWLVFDGFYVIGNQILNQAGRGLRWQGLIEFTDEKPGWVGLWGAWHLLTLYLFFTVAGDWIVAQQAVFQSVAFQLEGLYILVLTLLMPLLASYIISRVYSRWAGT